MGALSRLLPIEKLTPSIEFVLGQITDSSMATLYCILKDNTNLFQTANKIAEVHAQLQKGLKDDRLSVCENAVLGTGKFLENNRSAEYDDLVLDLVNVIKDNSADVRRTALIVLKNLAKCRHEIVKPQLNIIVPVLMMFVRDKIIPVKLACERTLLYVLKLNESATVMEEFLSSADPSVAKSLTDYHRRVLSKMVQDGVESDYEQLDDKLYDESM
ncbi:hypothetical protein BKA69DRAFT_914267 [Paraphysoderma sedebokerense]|nr:hypothetical protein BKA69DRAFT_914267 [Paraphysoderma sedebokerense]